MADWIKRFCSSAGVALALLAAPAFSFAADVGCGRDTDRGGTVDQACPEPDKDADGYRSFAGTHFATGFTAVDCDDTKSLIVPGTIDTAGCAANQSRRCKTDGTWTTCVAHSSAVVGDFSNAANGLALFWVDPTKTADTGTGTFASPLSPRSLSDAARSTYHAPAAGDVFVFMGTGDFVDDWDNAGTARMLYVNNKDGNSTNPIRWILLSGANFVGQGVSPTEVQIFHFVDSTYQVIQGEAGASINSGYSNAGIFFNGDCDDSEIFRLTVYDIDGDGPNNNLAGIKSDNADRVFIHNNVVYGNYARANPTSTNNAEIYVTKANRFRVIANTITQSVASGYGIKNKHIYAGIVDSGGSDIAFNILYNIDGAAIQWLDERVRVEYNFLHTVGKNNNPGGSLRYTQDGGGDFSNSTIKHNTIFNSPFFELRNDDGTQGDPILTVSNNVVIDDRGTAYSSADNYNDGFIRLCHYCDNTTFTATITGGLLSIDNNCYYNSAAVALGMSVWADPGSGASGQAYASFAAWQAAFDAASHSENPTLDAYTRATSTNCANDGWIKTTDLDTAPASTGTTIGGSVYNFLRRRT